MLYFLILCVIVKLNIIYIIYVYLCLFMFIYVCLKLCYIIYCIGPWNHLGMGILGGYIGYHLPSWEQRLLTSVNEKRIEKGLSPIQRSSIYDLGGR